mgnify:CR=1 FL=1
MVGTAVRSLLPRAKYPTRRQLNLLSEQDVFKYVSEGSFQAVIHLAAKVGGVKANSDYVGSFYDENIRMNTNILRACALSDVPKVVSFLSTCVYPDKADYPLTEEQLHAGPPHSSNYGYAYAKRMMEVQSRAYRQQYGSNFICAIPNNLYGENDNFDLINGHVIPALMRRIWEAKLSDKQEVEVWGDGSPLREFTYSKDIARILLFLLREYNSPHPINIGRNSENSIKEVAEILCKNLDYKGSITWNTSKSSGQHRKPSSNKNLINLRWEPTDYTSLRKGLKETCKWFKINYPLQTRSPGA